MAAHRNPLARLANLAWQHPSGSRAKLTRQTRGFTPEVQSKIRQSSPREDLLAGWHRFDIRGKGHLWISL